MMLTFLLYTGRPIFLLLYTGRPIFLCERTWSVLFVHFFLLKFGLFHLFILDLNEENNLVKKQSGNMNEFVAFCRWCHVGCTIFGCMYVLEY